MRVPKYRNKATEVDGIKFDSLKQARRYGELKLLEKAGKIDRLECEPVYRLTINGVLVCKFMPDFQYMELAPDGYAKAKVVEDVKSEITRKNRAYRIKHKLMKAVYGIDVREV